MKELLPFAVYSIENFDAGIMDNEGKGVYEFEFDYHPIVAVSFSSEKNNDNVKELRVINKAVVTYQEGTTIDRSALEMTKKFLERYLMMFAINHGINPCEMNVTLKAYRTLEEDRVNHHVFEYTYCSSEVVGLYVFYQNDDYRDIFQDGLLVENDIKLDEDFQIFKSILDVRNPESRYLLQYEFLKHLVSDINGTAHGSQAQVKRFVTDEYNPQVNDEKKIEFDNNPLKPNETLDCLTICRNTIGHPAVTEAEKNQNQNHGLNEMFSRYSKDINEVILFGIRKKNSRP